MSTPPTEIQFSLSTAEEEKNYFSGSTSPPHPEVWPEDVLPPGTYRVIDGELFRVAAGVPLLE